MAEKKTSGFRFRLPWLLQPAEPSNPRTPTQPPRTTTQTSVASTPAQKPPFRPPGKAPAPPPATRAASPPNLATPAPLSPKGSPPQSVAPQSPPPPPSTVVSLVPSTAETIEPVATQPTRETQDTIKTSGPAIPPPVPPSSPPRQAQSQPSPPQTPSPPSPSVSPCSSVPSSPIAKATEPVAAQPAKETQTTTETIPTIETAGSATPPPTLPLRAPTQAHSQPSPPQTSPPSKRTPTRSPPRSPTGLASKPTDKTSPLPAPSPPPKTTSEVSETKRLTEVTNKNFPADSNHIPPGNHLVLDENSRKRAEMRGTQTKSLNSHSMDLKAGKPKVITAKRVPLHRDIKDGISRFIHEIATSPAKQSTDEKAASVVTIAGDNTGALMHLVPDEINRSHKLTTDMTHRDAGINGDGSSQGDSKASEDKETKAIVNSNIQGINNSMIINSSVNERDPGVHLGFYNNPANTNDSLMKNTESTEMHRAEVNITPPQKVVYDPTRGRTLEGATTEPGESEFEADDPETSDNANEIEVL